MSEDQDPVLLNLIYDSSSLPSKRSSTKWAGRYRKNSRHTAGKAAADQNLRRKGIKADPRKAQGTGSLKGYSLGETLEEKGTEQSQSRQTANSTAPSEAAAEERSGDLDASDEEGLQAALELAKRQDEKVAAEDARSSPDSVDTDEELGVVSFMDSHTSPTKPRKRKKDAPAPKPLKKRKGLGNVHPKAGELVHAISSIPVEEHIAVYGSGSGATFAALGLAASLASHLEETGFKTPTQIQRSCIPILQAGRDALVEAPTGSGKTLAYLAPIIHSLQAIEPRLSRADGTAAIVIVPTRELCIQVCDVLSSLLKRFHWLVRGAITGGENRLKEKARLRKGIIVLVATPGRLLDHLESTTAFRTNELRWLILDEADRLLDLGFEQKIGDIVKIIDERLQEAGSRQRQTVLLSATMHSKLQQLVTLSLDKPVKIGFRQQPGTAVKDSSADQKSSSQGQGDNSEDAFTIPAQLKQKFLQVSGRQRLAALAAVLRRAFAQGSQAKLVVFMSSCDGVEFHHYLFESVYKKLAGEPLLACPIWKLHGNLPQVARTQTFLDFSRCSSGVLLCTDVAARGLDFPSVTCIVQYDPPGEVTEYVHRVGRTARMGQKGEAILFLLPAELGYLDLMRKAGVDIQKMDLSKIISALPSTFLRGDPNNWRSSEEPPEAAAFHARLSSAVSHDPHLRALASDAFRSFVRAYATHPASLRDVFHVRRLHLGHVAHSFALKEAPTLLGKSGSKAAKKAKDAQHSKTKQKRLHGKPRLKRLS